MSPKTEKKTYEPGTVPAAWCEWSWLHSYARDLLGREVVAVRTLALESGAEVERVLPAEVLWPLPLPVNLPLRRLSGRGGRYPLPDGRVAVVED